MQTCNWIQPCAWENSCWFVIAFWTVAILFSVLFGTKATEMLAAHVETKGKAWAWWVYQFWFNFVGSFCGWIALAAIIRNVCLAIGQAKPLAPQWSDVALFFLAFIGVTGHLPLAVMTGIGSIQKVVEKLPGFK